MSRTGSKKPTTDSKESQTESKPEIESDILTDSISEEFERLQESDADFQKFLKMLIDSGELSKGATLEADEQQSIISKFTAWKEDGMKSLQMPKLTEKEVPIPSLIVRVKHLGQQYLWWRDTKGNEYDIERIPVYRKVKDLDPESQTHNQEIDDLSTVISHKDKFLKEYNRKEGLRLVELGRKMNPDGLHCVFKFGTNPVGFTVGTTDFNVPSEKDKRTFDDIIALHKRNDYVPT